MASIGVVVESLAEFSRLRASLAPEIVALIPAEALMKERFSDEMKRSAPYVIANADVTDSSVISFCRYHGIRNIAVRIDRVDFVDAASAAASILAENPDFVLSVITGDPGQFMRFSRFVGDSVRVYAIAEIPVDANRVHEWLAVHVSCVILTGDHFRADYSLVSDVFRVVLALCERNCTVLLDSKFEELEPVYARLRKDVKVPRIPNNDMLVRPMETIAVDLPESAYRLFEMDLAKYGLYFDAIARAIEDRKRYNVAVVGAGRGPLVDCAIAAGAKSVIVIERNHEAVAFLRHRRETDWKKAQVEIIEGDVRNVRIPKKVDIIVSELLGGFADNELSPECLSACDEMLNDGGVFIPESYRSIIVPICSQHLWCKAKDEKRIGCMCVVPRLAALRLSDPAIAWSFKHPGSNKLSKKCELKFEIREDSVVHGFEGWFEATLYDNIVMISDQKRSNVTSWFPVLFPLENPISVTKGSEITAVFLRKSAHKRVWYEWGMLHPEVSALQNVAGSVFSFKCENIY